MRDKRMWTTTYSWLSLLQKGLRPLFIFIANALHNSSFAATYIYAFLIPLIKKISEKQTKPEEVTIAELSTAPNIALFFA